MAANILRISKIILSRQPVPPALFSPFQRPLVLHRMYKAFSLEIRFFKGACATVVVVVVVVAAAVEM